MSWIGDVRHEVQGLDLSRRSLRKFGLMVGPVFVLLAWVAWRKHWGALFTQGFAFLGVLLLVLGVAMPAALRLLYTVWMAVSFAIGWLVSRVLLTILFVLAVVPMGLLGRLLNLPFVRLRRSPPQKSLWVDKPPRSPKHHEEMF